MDEQGRRDASVSSEDREPQDERATAEGTTEGPQEVPPQATPVGHSGARVDVTERRAWAVNGFLALLVGVVLLGVAIYLAVIGGIALDAGTGGLGALIGAGVLLVGQTVAGAPGQGARPRVAPGGRLVGGALGRSFERLARPNGARGDGSESGDHDPEAHPDDPSGPPRAVAARVVVTAALARVTGRRRGPSRACSSRPRP